ncbi:MAG: cytochrome c biogenesis CcdA family protein [Pseudonocardiaceae bacterium]
MNSAALAFALVAGAVAAFNPCGFALLPAYLGLLVAGDGPDGRAAAMRRAVRFTAGMTAGFVAVFGLVAAVLSLLALSIERYLPVVTVVIGVLLVGLGGWLLAGRQLTVPGLAGHGSAPAATWWSQIGYGVSFALASLSCTIAPFLAVTAGSLPSGGPLGVAGAFLAYALGMGTVVLVLALAVAAARTSLVTSMRRAGAAISRGSGALLVVAGAYVAWYGWFEIRVLAGSATSDPVISAAVGVQATISRWVAGLGAGGLLAVAAGLAAVLAAAILVRRARTRRSTEPVG